MKYFYLITIVLIFGSCDSEFIDRSQAKNEVNKKGFRIGKWVDYLDEYGTIVIDTNKYTSYLMSEYKEGKPNKKFKEFYRNGVLKSTGEFMSDTSLYDKNSIPSKFINNHIIYSTSGKIQESHNYNSSGKVIEELYNMNQDTLRVIYTYSPKNFNRFQNIKLTDKKSRIVFEFSEKSWYSDTSGLPNTFKTKMTNAFKEGVSKNNKTADDKLISKILEDIFSLNEFLLYANLMQQETFETGKAETINIADIFTKSYKSWKSNSSSNSSPSRSEGSTKTCRYCGRTFYKNQGYVEGVGILCAKNYASAMFEISIAAKAGYSQSNLKQLLTAYEYGYFYCSRRCVIESGTSLCSQ